ncbi:recombinase family protein [Candidatus Tisiphia endosymbiont of Stenodema calcarata]|uniref:recombinase family protein n=1 Tax=Candidatus Tisiphia endosymbiont of Stenodema calcarata TaxID=3139337 RepID=UPI003CCAA734
MTDKATKSIILVRVSTREQEEGYSIEAQKYRLVEYCQRKNLEVIETFEIIESSSRGDRKQFKEMIKFAKSHRETIAIVADKVDRVQRRISEISLLEEPIKAGKIELHFRTEGYIIDKDSQSHAKLMWGMNVLIAQSYVDSLSDNVKRSLDHKLRKGEWIGPAPLGYLNSRDERGNSIVILDPVRGSIIKKLFEEYATGMYTLNYLTEKAKELGLRSKNNCYVNKTVVHRMIQQPFYYGEMRVKGEMWSHGYQAIITKETFMACKDVRLGWKKKPFKYGGKDFLFRGLITCAVTGKVVTAETHSKTYSDGKVDEWTYLGTWDPKNPNKKIYVREDEVLKQVEEVFKRIGIRDPEMLKETLAYLKNTNELKKDEHGQATAALKKEHTENENRLNSLIDLRLNGELSTEEFQRKKQQLKDRQYEIARLIKVYEEADDKFTDTATTLITLASEAYETFKGSESPQKRKMINFVFQNLKLRGKKLETSLRFPFDIFEKTTTCTEWRRERDSNPRYG